MDNIPEFSVVVDTEVYSEKEFTPLEVWMADQERLKTERLQDEEWTKWNESPLTQ